ncbi:hypothetical protein COW36_13630 [bacterium (Candidatus Blackallbacteria) CG17_big_fil_post_rev_8_21_14_2_50_48_46]|uniref:Uncharacterized protein n=1 Tax=bacterium (Candidatus Blackallbacteria) CG17_big_fil_post_rev_8_21_14_2_50_48_46 TaxID=2014261 RepID=A0A2M7G3G5_9BACT|nr:MAG: hypothetical protein COW64_22250 [bacterium (Candidatus Blackallbacteria) CG18_big_fil_WC_8_21_14_2_50_49_26]PIW16365.1 MAG: hypothetical protein COW36_13630 [bacterium (Candidatus Blackallbacteria) CG17_big_fil_post_rev_8_21_14_2_50_48_46]
MTITAVNSSAQILAPQTQKPATQAQVKPAEPQTQSMASDSLSVSKQPKLGESVKEGLKFQSKLGAQTGAIGGAVAGGLGVPLLVFAFTMGAPLNDPKLAWGSLAVGVLGGAAVGAGIGAAQGALSGIVNGAVVSVAKNKTQAQLGTAALAGASNLAYDLYKGKSLPTALVSSAVTAGVAGWVGGAIYDKATH